jgi:hypothetical protein
VRAGAGRCFVRPFAGLPELLAQHVRPGGECGVNAHLKVGCLVAGMAAGADSIDDMGLLRHGAMDALFGGVRAPSTLGSHLRSYAWGNVLQIEKAGRGLLARLSRRAPLLPGADVLAFIDIDSTQKRVYRAALVADMVGRLILGGRFRSSADGSMPSGSILGSVWMTVHRWLGSTRHPCNASPATARPVRFSRHLPPAIRHPPPGRQQHPTAAC